MSKSFTDLQMKWIFPRDLTFVQAYQGNDFTAIKGSKTTWGATAEVDI